VNQRKESRSGLVTIIADETTMALARELYGKCPEANREARLFNLENMRIEPCYACHGCEEKTYGRCVVRDDADLILPFAAHAETIVIFTPVVFGGYSFRVKRIVDKLGLIGDRHYFFQKGELTKGEPSGRNYYVVGIQAGVDKEEAAAFKYLINETLKLATWSGGPIVMPHETNEYNAMIREATCS